MLAILIEAAVSREMDMPTIRSLTSSNPVSAVPKIHLKTETYTGNGCTCSLCLDEIKDGSDIHRLSCNHIFHAYACIDNKSISDWISENHTCPNCRAKIDESKTNEPDSDDIKIVMEQASVSRRIAINELRAHKNVVDAIIACEVFSSTDDLDSEDIQTVMTQASVSRNVATRALRKHKNIVDAICECMD